MTFDRPWALALILVVPLLIALYWLLLRRRRRFAVSYASLSLIRDALPKRPRWRRHVPFALFLLALASLAVGTARPQATVTVPTSRTTIILALDVSLSMCATDVEPNRLAVAREVAHRFIQDQPVGTKIGIVAFAGSAQLIAPPTTDHEELTTALDGLRAGRGTAVGTALLRSVDAIATVNQEVPRSDIDMTKAQPSVLPPGQYQPDIIVLLSDGATTQGVAPMLAAQQVADRHLRVYSIGFGTPAPTILSCSREQLGTDYLVNQFAGGGGGGFGRRGADGPPRSVLRIDERTLEAIAELTGGAYHRAADAEELVDVFRNLPKEVALQRQHTEISFGFTAAGAALLTAATLLSLAWNRTG
ncbi:MAG: VWA domain-containing protein [Dehalococcoidia bacterium]